MRVEAELAIFSREERDRFWNVVNSRNDIAHVQPDLHAEPATVLYQTAALLGTLMPAGCDE
jgi:hypothetical protein